MLAEEKKQKIKNTAEEILKKYNKDTGNVDVVKLANALGFSVYPLIPTADCDGIIIVNKESKPINKGNINDSKLIAYKVSVTKSLNRYIIAYELGQYFLNSDKTPGPLFTFKFYSSKMNNNNDGEEEAEYFALNLLVPQNLLDEALLDFKSPVSDVYRNEILANKFEVEPIFIKKRIEGK